jgi:hypothetical protein
MKGFLDRIHIRRVVVEKYVEDFNPAVMRFCFPGSEYTYDWTALR